MCGSDCKMVCIKEIVRCIFPRKPFDHFSSLSLSFLACCFFPQETPPPELECLERAERARCLLLQVTLSLKILNLIKNTFPQVRPSSEKYYNSSSDDSPHDSPHDSGIAIFLCQSLRDIH